jgi:hypothetical protein
LSIATLIVGYVPLLNTFPWVTITSTKTYVALAMFVLDNISWYSYFLGGGGEHPFWAIVAFFFAMVWTVPAEFFVSLAVEDERLPDSSSSSRSVGGGISLDDGRRSSVWRSLVGAVTALASGDKKQRN